MADPMWAMIMGIHCVFAQIKRNTLYTENYFALVEHISI